ncbi:hypothetical protein Bbelb_430040 [Branchiostoma belcheri]|nr:hypothetical protein Bbelb_430040 [Branchiostoma belcheri]
MAINISAPAQRSFTEQQVLQEVAMRTADSRLHPHGFWLFLIAYTCSPAFTAAETAAVNGQTETLSLTVPCQQSLQPLMSLTSYHTELVSIRTQAALSAPI